MGDRSQHLLESSALAATAASAEPLPSCFEARTPAPPQPRFLTKAERQALALAKLESQRTNVQVGGAPMTAHALLGSIVPVELDQRFAFPLGCRLHNMRRWMPRGVGPRARTCRCHRRPPPASFPRLRRCRLPASGTAAESGDGVSGTAPRQGGTGPTVTTGKGSCEEVAMSRMHAPGWLSPRCARRHHQ